MLAKLMAFFSAISMFFAGLFGFVCTDKMPENPEFPIIQAEAQENGTVRVMSFNVRCTDVNGTPASRRRQIVADEIILVSPDSVGVQEATTEWMRYLKAALPGYVGVGLGRDGENLGEHSAVFYNSKKWKLLDSDTFWLSETPDRVSKDWDSDCRRICTWALLENRETGEKYAHVNSHFDHVSGLARENSAKMICSFIAEKFADISVVFTADMNSRPSAEAYKTMTGCLQDCRFAAADSVAYGTFHNTDPVGNANTYLDYVMTKPGTEVRVYRTVTAGIDGRFVSDHFPIYADLVLR